MTEVVNQEVAPELDPRVPLQAGDEDGSIEQNSSSDTGNDPRPDDQPPP